MRFALALAVFLTLTLSLRSLSTIRAASTIDRPADPVVLTGANVPSLAGIAPDDLVAFRYLGGWQQIPVQVDERAVVTFSQVYGNASSGVSQLQYTDDGTFTGADPNATLDADDEIAFMARDAGDAAGSTAEPAGVVPGSGVQVALSDPLDAGASGYVYLFESADALDPGAGEQYVAYTFNLLSGPYLTTYDTQNGPNPENTTISSTFYERHFTDRWADDRLRVTVGASTGVDVLDRHKQLFAPGVCGRSEDTFDDAEGAFVINKSGPVRALRSYIGANSGPLTQREHVFYEQRQDVRTFLRVHAIPGIMDFYDYSPAASGMTYRNNLNLAGVTIDGVPTETVAAGMVTWESVDGAQGAIVLSHSFSTNIPSFSPTSYYLDDTTPPVTQCTGDAFAYGSSGQWVNQGIPNTDPASGGTNFLNTVRTLYYLPPGQTAADAQARHNEAQAPLTFTVSTWSADADGDGVTDVADNCPITSNAAQADGDADALGDACEASPYGTNPADRDTDDDGCADGREVRTLTFTPTMGGGRNPLLGSDFYDVNATAKVDAVDIGLVRSKFNPSEATLPEDLIYDRSTGAAPWAPGPADNVINAVDIGLVRASFLHSCVAPP